MSLQFTCVPFKDLTVYQLYDIMALRQEVFIVEQNCPYLDADGKDLLGWHLMGRNREGVLLAYTRLLPKGIAYDNYISIGRVITSNKGRGMGYGQQLMKESIVTIKDLYLNEPTKIGAQTYLLKFYQSFGFVSTGEEYMEDGIPHTAMVLL
jgi:ElaA protein